MSEPIEMKKIYRSSQERLVLGRPVYGPDRHKYGLPYDGASGHFFPEDPDGMDLMFAAAEKYFPEIHIVSYMHNSHMYNRYVEGADFYWLYTGNTDPEIEVTPEWSDDDFTPEELAQQRKQWQDDLEALRNPKPSDIAAVKWMLENAIKPKKKSA